jgi:hypothetical protein
MEIEVKVTATTEVAVDVTVTPVDGRFPGPPGAPRYRFVLSDDLVLERIDNKKPGNGLPQSAQGRLAGTHSGFATTLRVADAKDKFFSEAACSSSTRHVPVRRRDPRPADRLAEGPGDRTRSGSL